MAEEKPAPEMALVKQNSLDKAVKKLEGLKKRNERNEMIKERREERRIRAQDRRERALLKAEERAWSKQEVKEVRENFGEQLFRLAQQTFGYATIKNRIQFEELKRDELYALAEELVKKAKPWAMFQNVLKGVFIVTGIAIPFTLGFLGLQLYLAYALFVMIFTHAFPLFVLYYTDEVNQGTISWRYMNAYRVVCKQDGPKYIKYLK